MQATEALDAERREQAECERAHERFDDMRDFMEGLLRGSRPRMRTSKANWSSSEFVEQLESVKELDEFLEAEAAVAAEEEVPEKAEEAWPPLDPMSPLKEARMRRFVFFEDDELDEQGSGYDSSGEYF